jgi:hypothetical protein
MPATVHPGRISAANRAIVQVGDGRGFIVSAGETRFVITAAHCLPEHPSPHLANGISDLTYPNIIGRLGATRRTIWAELVVDDVASDIAVLTEPDGQELYDQCRRYETFTRPAMMIGRAPELLPPQQWQDGHGAPAFVLSLDGQWQACTVQNRNGRFLWMVESHYSRSGMSGSPIVDQSGAAIGLISTSGSSSSVNPMLMDCLPLWLSRQMDKAEAVSAGSSTG